MGVSPTASSGSGSLRKGGDTGIVTAPASERHSQGMHAELLLVLSGGSEVDSDAKGAADDRGVGDVELVEQGGNVECVGDGHRADRRAAEATHVAPDEVEVLAVQRPLGVPDTAVGEPGVKQ